MHPLLLEALGKEHIEDLHREAARHPRTSRRSGKTPPGRPLVTRFRHVFAR